MLNSSDLVIFTESDSDFWQYKVEVEVYYNQCPSYLSNNFERREDSRLIKKTFYYHGIVDWNSLPGGIKAVKNVQKCKLLVKHIYLIIRLQTVSRILYTIDLLY